MSDDAESDSLSGSGPWRACLASVRGREHVRLGKNNQDAAAGCRVGDTVAVVVADGCGESAFSEVGSRLVARFVAQRAAAGVGPEAVVDALVEWLGRISLGQQFVEEQLLTTFLCAVARGPAVTVFGIGDGLVHVDGLTRVLDPGPENAPAYVAYRLVGLDAELVVHHVGAAQRVAIGTDGAHGLSLDSSFGWKNPLSLQRRLNTTNGLNDDATLALLELGGQP